MTEPDNGNPLDGVLHAIHELSEKLQEAITATGAASSGLDRVEAKSDRRARTFRWLWALLAALMILTIAATVRADRHNTATDGRVACFQTWANDTAARTQTLTAASNTRIQALNRALDVIVDKTATPTDRSNALTAAALAGDAYEQIARANPPIPASELECT